VALGKKVIGGQLASMDVVDDDVREPAVAAVDEHDRQVVALQCVDLVVGEREGDHQQAVDAVVLGEVAQRVGALSRRLHVEEHQVIAVLGEVLADSAQALDDRRGGEEGCDDADRL
jgi:hypothetical protein